MWMVCASVSHSHSSYILALSTTDQTFTHTRTYAYD